MVNGKNPLGKRLRKNGKERAGKEEAFWKKPSGKKAENHARKERHMNWKNS